MFKFIHTADIHLDSPLLNLTKYDDVMVDEFRSATRRAFDNIVELAISEEVDFMLIAGDLYDGDCKDFNTPLHFRDQMRRLGEQGIPVFLINGNHDAANKMKVTGKIRMPDNVHVFPTKEPGTAKLDDLKVAIHGQGFAQQAVTEDLSKNYPEPTSGYFNIGMLHTSCGSNEQHDNYAPSTIRGLSEKEYEYWALGHIHKHRQLTKGRRPIVYCGNPQGRSVKECGPRGCYIVSVDGQDVRLKHHEVDVVRWVHLNVEIDECETPDDVLVAATGAISAEQAAANERPIAVRIEFVGASKVHDELVRNLGHWDEETRTHAINHFDDVWIEKIQFNTRAPVERSFEVDSAVGELVERLRNPQLGQNAFNELQSEFEKMLGTIPDDKRADSGDVDLDRPETVATLISGAQELLVAKLTEVGGDA